ncbi:hypothetical protein JOE30_001790 [Rhodococcus sp. PvP016]|uniref:Uncharacterized protein n=1 Tax=Rhodococcoides corynebacterioides TaxID=53972 RepID=A0ABS2KNH7_9NOCA|nr:hypothetical protein [Rhodococcus corynebacterioides]MBP1115993.1 hypothetical protein [Rhodococcus sp. PvP016]
MSSDLTELLGSFESLTDFLDALDSIFTGLSFFS